MVTVTNTTNTQEYDKGPTVWQKIAQYIEQGKFAQAGNTKLLFTFLVSLYIKLLFIFYHH